MLAARKIEEICNCGNYPEQYCDGCGEPLCIECIKIEVTGIETRKISQKKFCHECHADPMVNVWGTAYWPRLASMFV